MMYRIPLALVLVVGTIGVYGEIFFSIEYSHCYGAQKGINITTVFKSEQMHDGWGPLLQDVWRASPQYHPSGDDAPLPIHCRDLNIHVQGKVHHHKHLFIDCETTVSYDQNDGGNYVSLFRKFQQLYETCETTEIQER